MKFHVEGRRMLGISISLLILCTLSWFIYGSTPLLILLLILLMWTGFVVYFFRNPHRPIVEDPSAIYAPADGKIVVIEKVFEPEFIKEERWQVSIFMSPANVHANRIPVSGEIEYTRYHPGKFLVAWHPKASTDNERNTVVIRDLQNRLILIRQIAGAMARRIVCYLEKGRQVQQGEELGFIKFGSRVDIFLPHEANILVRMNQEVKGNVDVLARWSEKK